MPCGATGELPLQVKVTVTANPGPTSLKRTPHCHHAWLSEDPHGLEARKRQIAASPASSASLSALAFAGLSLADAGADRTGRHYLPGALDGDRSTPANR